MCSSELLTLNGPPETSLKNLNQARIFERALRSNLFLGKVVNTVDHPSVALIPPAVKRFVSISISHSPDSSCASRSRANAPPWGLYKSLLPEVLRPHNPHLALWTVEPPKLESLAGLANNGRYTTAIVSLHHVI